MAAVGRLWQRPILTTIRCIAGDCAATSEFCGIGAICCMTDCSIADAFG